jgi:hypothetical protein
VDALKIMCECINELRYMYIPVGACCAGECGVVARLGHHAFVAQRGALAAHRRELLALTLKLLVYEALSY